MALHMRRATYEVDRPFTAWLQSPLVAGYIAALMAMGWTMGSMLSSGRSPSAGMRAISLGPVVVLAGLVTLAVFLPVEGAA
ncbi:hypothetical protein QA644_20845 [Rhizobium sp. CC1099]|uniref:hypothetical protein n=1 Tax=Rhizobium sp. CC1099 TaxID=3039160 RepID=UPI0024B0C01C|nr:hypothetical protein [Rhizobium sp. CC1099]WFU87466.1 hypothetical protein QA644_20845 [Rhizobium sp. CC1099]